jgi:hypothetical protein
LATRAPLATTSVAGCHLPVASKNPLAGTVKKQEKRVRVKIDWYMFHAAGH